MTAMVLLSTWMESQVEIWRPIKDHDGYDVSSHGRVRSWRVVKRLGNRLGSRSSRREIPRILKSYVSKEGYVVIGVGGTTNGIGRIRPKMHRLVAEAFLPNPEGLPSVNHLTGLKTDNRLDGLAWASWKTQSKHAWEHGLHKRNRVEVAKKLNAGRRDYRDIPDSMIRMIRNALKDGVSQSQIRRWSGLNYLTIQSIAVGRTYKDVA